MVAPVVQIKKKKFRWLTVSSILFLGILLVLGGYAVYQVYDSLPQVEGELALPGLIAPVQVVRDEHGVPHIVAENDHDLYLAQGFVTAQDRLFQMDLSRRAAAGRLSEVFGEDWVSTDKFFRTLGLKRAAVESYHAYSQEAKQILDWYAKGVNLYIKQAKENGTLPVEFSLLGYEPEEWTPVDSLSIGKYMAFDLGGHWENQAFLYYLLQKFPKEKALELFPTKELNTPTIIPDAEAVDVEKSFAQAVVSHPHNGSNNWVISGAKSASGKPMLANDPHLGLRVPAIWYLTHLKSPDVNVSGVIFPGVPGIILGHNDRIAWGVTNTGPDVQDLYIEKRHPEKKDHFLYMGKWEKAKVISEPIRVKGGKTIDYKVTITRHGPVISEFAYESGKNTVFALRWTALEPSTELEALIRINRAKDWSQFEKALEYFHTPMQNFVFASRDGTIAYKANGKIPIRKKGDGLLPVPGWTDEYEWIGYVPFDKLPKMVNPKSGIIATANNKVISDRYPYHISHYWLLPYRQKRILQVLNSKSKFIVKDFQALQMDQYNLQAAELVPIFVRHLSKVKLTEEEKTAVNILKHWNFLDQADQAAPLIYHHLFEKIGDTLFAGQISPNMMKLFKNRDFVVDVLIRRADRGEKSLWIAEKGGLEKVLQTALQQTLKELKEKFGDDLHEWQWGENHAVQFDHPLASAWFLSPLFGADERYPMGGSNLTVQAADWDRQTGLVNHGASWRMVVDTADLNRSYHLLGPGQSGHILSKWYDDQAEAWVKGVYHVHARDRLEKGKKLVLKPEE